jgi:hypothetical protein
MGRNLVRTTGGLQTAVARAPLLVPTGSGAQPPPPTDVYPWRIFTSATSPWNTKINWGTAVTSGLGKAASGFYGQTGHAYISSDVSGTMTFYEDASSITWSIFDQKNNRTVSVKAPSNLAPANNPTDFNAQVVTLSGVVWDLYGLTINGTGSATCLGTNGASNTGMGVGDFTTKANAGFRASGYNWAAGAITLKDYNAGIIPHALVVALNGAGLADPFVYPAVSRDATGAYTGTLPQGALMGIPPSTPKPAGMSTIGSLMWDAHRDYGVYVGDRTGGWNWYSNWGPQDRVPNAVVEPLRSAPYDGDKIVSALVRVRGGKPTIPHHD